MSLFDDLEEARLEHAQTLQKNARSELFGRLAVVYHGGGTSRLGIGCRGDFLPKNKKFLKTNATLVDNE